MLSEERFAGFKQHPRLEGTHAFLSPSNPYWLRYDPDRLIERLDTAEAAALGTELHETAARNIRRGIKIHSCREWPILVPYVNDAIDFGMTPEQMLFYSFNCYGTADVISFDEEDRFLRIHDLKTGTSKVTMDQLYVYAALFCLEYEYRPFQIRGELRIYQGDSIYDEEIDRFYLARVRDTIRTSDEIIEDYRRGRRA